jgi:hypothetical protein
MAASPDRRRRGMCRSKGVGAERHFANCIQMGQWQHRAERASWVTASPWLHRHWIPQQVHARVHGVCGGGCLAIPPFAPEGRGDWPGAPEPDFKFADPTCGPNVTIAGKGSRFMAT